MADELDTNEFNMEAAVEEIGTGLGLGAEDDGLGNGETVNEEVVEHVVAPVDTPVVRAAPKAWPKEMHDHWTKVDPAVQDYLERREQEMQAGSDYIGLGRKMTDAITPFKDMLNQHQVEPVKAVSYLLAAHQRLSYGSTESRMAAYKQLGQDLGFAEVDPAAPQANPELQALRDKVTQLEQGFSSEREAKLNEIKEKNAKEVDTFASDPAHPYFDEVAEDMMPFLQAGVPLNDAYEKAIWANTVTRAKEQARLQKEAETKLRENARLDALKAKKAKGSNVNTRETTRAPQEPLGTMDDTMKEKLAEIHARTH